MSDTPEPDPDNNGDFHRDGLRNLGNMHRSSDDKVIAGVCAGAARHLNVDPIILRIAVVALTFVGLSGLILYLAAWFLIPSDDEPQSIAAEWFNLDRNEEQVRTIGLFVALVLAVAAIVGDHSWSFGWLAWPALLAVFLFWLFSVRPRRRREETLAGWSTDPDVVKTQVEEYTAAKTAQIMERKRVRLERRRGSRALRGLTLSVLLIAEAVTLIVDRTLVNVPVSGYIAVALTVVAIGCLVGTVWGNAGGLVAVGILLTLALVVSSAAPAGPVGHQLQAPPTANSVKSSYRHGVGQLELDLSRVKQPDALAGRTITVKAGVGQTLIYVPETLPIRLDVDLRAGEINAFGRQWHGRNNTEQITDGDPKRALRLVVHQRFGEVKVVRR